VKRILPILLMVCALVTFGNSLPLSKQAPFFVQTPVAPGGGGGDTQFITGGSGSTLNNFTSTLGYSFIPAANMTITQLDRQCNSGDSQLHTNYLISADGTTLLASNTVSMSGHSAGDWVFANVIGSPVAVTVAGGGATGYIVVSTEINGGDHWVNDSAVTTTADATIVESRWYNGVAYSIGTVGVHSYGFVNMKYTVP